MREGKDFDSLKKYITGAPALADGTAVEMGDGTTAFNGPKMASQAHKAKPVLDGTAA